jgi:hypothetical protein
MTTDLEPPRVPPLTTAERSRLRNQLMDRTRPSTGHQARRWIAPVVGVGAVAAVVAGTLVVTGRPSASPGVAGTTTTPTASRSSLEVVPDAEARALFAKSCAVRLHLQRDQPVTVRWARRVPGEQPGSSEIVMIVQGAGSAGAGSCVVPHGSGGWRKQPSAVWTGGLPTAAQGVAALTGGMSSNSAPKPTSRVWMVYRVRPEIARIEARLVAGNVVGNWTPGYVDDGYAYADSRVSVEVAASRSRQEVRAYDAQGKQVPVG